MQDQALQTAVVGVLSALVTELLKRIDSVPLSTGQVKAISATVGVLSLAATFGTHLLSHDLANTSGVQSAVTVVVQSVVSYLVAHGTYAGLLSHILPKQS